MSDLESMLELNKDFAARQSAAGKTHMQTVSTLTERRT
jgi:hypothetical protein